MAALGTLELVIVGVFLLVGVAAALSGRTTKLVLQKLVAHEAASGESQPVIELVGRQQGLISFLLTLVGISPITDFKITPDELCCNSTSLFGRQNQSVPLRAISSVSAGVRKPVGYLFLAFVFLLVGVFGGLGVLWNEGIFRFVLTLLVFGAFAGLFTWLYVINKRFFVSIYTHGGPPVLLSLKPNVIEGVPLDLERALQVVKIIRERILTSSGPAPVAALGSAPARAANDRSAGQAPPAFEPGPAAPPSFDYDDFSGTDPEPALADLLLQQARDLIKQGQRQAAVAVLQEIVLRFPGSAEAGVAKATLQKAGISV
jgi:hypothetical protein